MFYRESTSPAVGYQNPYHSERKRILCEDDCFLSLWSRAGLQADKHDGWICNFIRGDNAVDLIGTGIITAKI